MVISAEVTQHHGCSKWNWPQVQKSQNLYKQVFHKRKKRYERGEIIFCVYLLCLSVRPLYQLDEKHHQIRAYILLIKVIAVRHHQIRVAFCQVDSITAVRHLVRGFPQSKTLVSRFFPLHTFLCGFRYSITLRLRLQLIESAERLTFDIRLRFKCVK